MSPIVLMTRRKTISHQNSSLTAGVLLRFRKGSMNKEEFEQIKELMKMIQSAYNQIWITTMINSITLFIVILHLIKLQNMLR